MGWVLKALYGDCIYETVKVLSMLWVIYEGWYKNNASVFVYQKPFTIIINQYLFVLSQQILHFERHAFIYFLTHFDHIRYILQQRRQRQSVLRWRASEHIMCWRIYKLTVVHCKGLILKHMQCSCYWIVGARDIFISFVFLHALCNGHCNNNCIVINFKYSCICINIIYL